MIAEANVFDLCAGLFLRAQVFDAPIEARADIADFLHPVVEQSFFPPGTPFAIDPSAWLAAERSLTRVYELRSSGRLPRVRPIAPPRDFRRFLNANGYVFLRRAWAERAATGTRAVSSKRSAGADVLARTQGATPYALVDAAELKPFSADGLWLAEGVWQHNGVGIIGGTAKGVKTWLALDLAVSVASGTRCLGEFRIHHPGGVLLRCAENKQESLAMRLNGMYAARGLNPHELPHRIQFITDRMRIDTAPERARLIATIAEARPQLLVLDPLVRLHRQDENSASQMSELLGFLSEVHEQFQIAIMVVHHTAKRRGGEVGGQDLRGSSDIHAWGDSNVFLGKKGPNLFTLRAEHRDAPDLERRRLRTNGSPPVLELCPDTEENVEEPTPEARRELLAASIEKVLLERGPSTVEEIREHVTGRNSEISRTIGELAARGLLHREGRRWRRA